MRMDKGITVIICTYNGALRLPKTLEHLAAQIDTDQMEWEIILVDNASTDDSAEVAKNEWAKYELKSVNFSVLHQSVPGKTHALELGFSKARFEYSIICDDDNWLAPDYLLHMYHTLNANPKIGAAGGIGIAIADSGVIPKWFKDYEDGYAIGRQGAQTGDITSRGHLWGAGLGTRTKLYLNIFEGFPSLLTGRLGNKLMAGEDSEYCQRLIMKGYILYFNADLIFHHYLPEGRLNVQYRINLFNGFKESNVVLSKYILANKIIAKCKSNKLKWITILLCAPFKMLFKKCAIKRENEKNTFIFLSPIDFCPNSIMAKLKRFYHTPMT